MKVTNKHIKSILEKKEFSQEDLIILLQADKESRNLIFRKSAAVKEKYVGKFTYFRGLIEFSNICRKDCYYCGIRNSNREQERYNLSDEEILKAAEFAYKNRFGSVVLQAGERDDLQFTSRITRLLKKIHQRTGNNMGITLSLGEQSEAVFQEWAEAGAHRYLLRIESSDKDLYYKIHPTDDRHNFEQRLNALRNLQKLGYQTGTGVMLALPFQKIEHLAGDLLFFRDFDIDMVGMGPYIEHTQTPLFVERDQLIPLQERFYLSLKMTAILRIMMKDINIAAATALQAIDPIGREKAIRIGANVLMPNITPSENRKNYRLYENKPCTDEGADDCISCTEARINLSGDEIGYDKRGDAPHYFRRMQKRDPKSEKTKLSV